jgi:protein-S-isoprenylcysteine O-methyltransferase Ste14
MNNSHAQNRDGLAGEHALTDIGQLVLLVVFLGIWISDSFVAHYSVFAAKYVPLVVRLPVALALLGASASLALRAHRLIFGKAAPAGVLITSGVFSCVRHPMYLGSWLFVCALTVGTFSMASTALVLMTGLFYYRVARYEEILLLKVYGAEYRDYRSRVPMFFPFRLGAGKL